uniref:AAA+ ATPase domain-containing protein n=1 Tax=Ascaris lumbricoides TaxID=6252 RepID=A0A9J2PW29_ASCLU
MGNQVVRPDKKGVAMPQHAPMKIARKPQKGPEASSKLPTVTPRRACLLRFLKTSRVHDYLLLEKEFIQRQSKHGSIGQQQKKERRIVHALRGSPIALARVHELFIDEQHAVVVVEGYKREWYVPILSIVDKDLIRIGALVMVKAHGSLKNIPSAVVGVLHDSVDSSSLVHKLEKAPKESFEVSCMVEISLNSAENLEISLTFEFPTIHIHDIGGLEEQIEEIKEAVELPLIHPEYYEDMGITAPKGVILYGEPGTGKTLLAKAVAHSTSATFIRATGADLIQKNSGEGAKLVRELFRLAKESAPCIVFIDEIDAVGTKRYDTSSGGEREVQRTLLELLNQMDGFESRGDVKIIMATNRIDVLDPALIRPGRIDRKIELPKPDEKTKLRIFQIHTSGMKIADEVKFEKIIAKERSLSGADCKAICTEAGMLALRAQRKLVCMEDFEKAMERVLLNKKSDAPEEFFL